MAAEFLRALERDPPLAAVALGRTLRAAGLPVTPDRSARFAAAARLTEPCDRAGLYWTARAVFVTAREQLAAFDAAFAALVDGLADPADARGDAAAPPPVLAGQHADRAASPAAADRRAAPGGATSAADSAPAASRLPPAAAWFGTLASDAERLAERSFADLDVSELAALRDLLPKLAVATPHRRTRRGQLAARGERLDVRATLRRSLRTGGDPVRPARRRRRKRPRPLVALLDVSGSMAPYARAYLLFLEGAARGAHAEGFVFATRLTRITRALREGRAEAALARAGRLAPDWSGGTRLGAALQAFNDRWGRRGLARGAVVVIVSDGWERGDPARVGREMQRLARLAHRIVWVNPRAAAPGFAPLAGGMAAALPHVDELVSGHSLAALHEVVEAIGGRDAV
ncbi:MAG TPA: VWA domain-containing protein [Solirubrobacteraceae bacterium]